MVTGTHRHHRHHRHHRTRTGSHHHGTAPAHHGHQHTKIDSAQLQAPTDSPDVPVSAPASDVNKNETSTPGSTLLGRTNNAVGGYTLHTGDGGSGWPTQSSWRSWDALVSANKPVMGKCLDGVAANSAEETVSIRGPGETDPADPVR